MRRKPGENSTNEPVEGRGDQQIQNHKGIKYKEVEKICWINNLMGERMGIEEWMGGKEMRTEYGQHIQGVWLWKARVWSI